MKICMECFRTRYPDKVPSIFTWSAQCGDCKVATPPRGLLIKVD